MLSCLARGATGAVTCVFLRKMNKKQKVALWIAAILIFLIGLGWSQDFYRELGDLVGKILIILVPAGLIIWALK